MVGSLPTARPTEAIPRAATARAGHRAKRRDARRGGRGARRRRGPRRSRSRARGELLADAHAASSARRASGVPAARARRPSSPGRAPPRRAPPGRAPRGRRGRCRPGRRFERRGARRRWLPPATTRCGSSSPVAAGSSASIRPTGSTAIVYRAGQELDSGEVPGRPVADRDRGDRRRRHRPRSRRLAHRSRRAHPATDGPERRGSPRRPNGAHRRPPASAAARDLQPLRRRQRQRRAAALDATGGHPRELPGCPRALPDR